MGGGVQNVTIIVASTPVALALIVRRNSRYFEKKRCPFSTHAPICEKLRKNTLYLLGFWCLKSEINLFGAFFVLNSSKKKTKKPALGNCATGPDWIGLDWNGLERAGLDWAGLDRTGPD